MICTYIFILNIFKRVGNIDLENIELNLIKMSMPKKVKRETREINTKASFTAGSW